MNLVNVVSIFLNKYETSGAIFSSFKNMIDANEKMMNHSIKEYDSKLSELEESIVNVKNTKTKTINDYTKRIEHLKTIYKEYET